MQTQDALSINYQDLSYDVDTSNREKIKDKIKWEKELFYKSKLDEVLENLNVRQKRLNEMVHEKGVSNWLNAYPLKGYGFDLNKQQFWDAISIRYGWSLRNLPKTGACGSKYHSQHSMSCKTGGLASITGDEARLDIRARIFWMRGQEAFLDIRVFNPNANRYLNATLPRCHEINEREKKQNYNNRILQIEHGTFTPLVFSIYGSMGRECTKFYSKLAEL